MVATAVLILSSLAAACWAGPSATAPRSLEAKRWWNSPTTQPAAERRSVVLDDRANYALLCFRKDDGKLLQKVVPRLNRLHARGEWNVIGLSPDDPNEILPLVYRYRICFPVGAGTREHLSFGARKLPCLIVLRKGEHAPQIHEQPDEQAGHLAGVRPASQPATAPAWPDTPDKLTGQTPVEILEACAVEAPAAEVRLAALRLLQARTTPEQFQRVLAEAMAAEPPPTYKDLFRPAFWYGIRLGRFTGTPDAHSTSYPGWAVRHKWRWILGFYKGLIAGMSMDQLAQDYLEHSGDGEADLLLRNAIIDRFEEVDPDELLRYLPTLINAERDVSLRASLVGWACEAWLKARQDHSTQLVPALLECLGPNEHIYVRAMAETLLRRIYGEPP